MRKFASAAGLYYFYMRMAKKFREKLRRLNPFSQPMTPERLPEPLPAGGRQAAGGQRQLPDFARLLARRMGKDS